VVRKKIALAFQNYLHERGEYLKAQDNINRKLTEQNEG
jgi:hypothetical protein